MVHLAGAFGYIKDNLVEIATVVVLIWTLKVQMKNYLKEEKKKKFYELLACHRELLLEIKNGNHTGRRVFVDLVRELRLIHDMLKNFDGLENINEADKMDIAFVILFYGAGPNSNRVLGSALENTFLMKYYRITDMGQKLSIEDKIIIKRIIQHFYDNKNQTKMMNKRELSYIPARGHMSRLGHYYRNLYQLIKFCEDNFNDTEAYQYVKIIRSQLSVHECALLILNERSIHGIRWRDEKLFNTYQLIKNLPVNFFDNSKEMNIKVLYPEIVFESDEYFTQRNSLKEKLGKRKRFNLNKKAKRNLIFLVIYLGTILSFAGVFYGIKNQFYHSTVMYERKLDEEYDQIKTELTTSIQENFKNVYKKEIIFIDEKEKWLFNIEDIEVTNFNYGQGEFNITLWITIVEIESQMNSENQSSFILHHGVIALRWNKTGAYYEDNREKYEMFGLEVVKGKQYINQHFEKNEIKLDKIFKLENYNMIGLVTDEALSKKLRIYSSSMDGFPNGLEGSFWRMLYLSMITITTLGFGDIVPLTNTARLLVGFEATLGIIIIGLYINSITTEKK